MRTARPIEFKGTTLSMTVLSAALKSADPAAIEAALAKLCAPGSDFFNGDPTIFDLADLVGETEIDWPPLVALLRRHRLNPFAIRGGGEAQVAAARAAGLTIIEDVALAAAPVPPPPPAIQAEPEPAREPESEPAPPLLPPAAGTLVIDRPLRSGQQVYARGGDLVVLAMVNAGAEVIADGNIHIYAPLRGRALAGARGDTGARILTTCFEGELTSIAGVYRTFEPGLPKDLAGQPAQVRLVGEAGGEQRLLIEALAIR